MKIRLVGAELFH